MVTRLLIAIYFLSFFPLVAFVCMDISFSQTLDMGIRVLTEPLLYPPIIGFTFGLIGFVKNDIYLPLIGLVLVLCWFWFF